MPTLVAANPCEESDALCEWVYRVTGQSEDAARLAAWFVDKPLQVLLIAAVTLVATRILRRWVRGLVRRSIDPKVRRSERLGRLGITTGPASPRRAARAESVSTVIASSLVVIVWSMAVMLMLDVVGIDLAPLLAGAGIAGIALGFGAQTLVRDCIAGLFMLLEDQFGIGDIVDLGEATGVVEEISLRATVLRSADGTVWHVPNGQVQRVGNRSHVWSVAMLDVAVAYATDLATARELIHRAATEVTATDRFAADVLEPPEVLGVETLGPDGVTLRLTAKVRPGTQYALQRALREHIKAVLDDAGVEIPFPQRTLWIRPGGDADETGDEQDVPGR